MSVCGYFFCVALGVMFTARPNATEEERHIGLRGMRERAAMVSGELSVRGSAPGVCWVPAIR